VREFRYAQFCSLARAAEILGERWTLLILRELALGGRRFSDLRRALPGISTSVLSARLARLERRGLVAQRRLPPPAPAVLYELAEDGRAFLPVLRELARFGLRFLGPARPGDHVEPGWVRLAATVFARREPTPARSFEVAVLDGEQELSFQVAGGPGGTAVREAPGPVDLRIRARAPLALLGLASGRLSHEAALASGAIEAEGDLSALADFPRLFEMSPSREPTAPGGAAHPQP
jgi:DNA-binding HxlR family transcriptional regulator